MKIVFLDFDGVLCSHAHLQRLRAEGKMIGGVMILDPEAVARLNRLLRETGAMVVVSSTWRKGRMRTELCDILAEAGFEGTVRGKTPDILTGPNGQRYQALHRGQEIQAWIDEWSSVYKLESYVILDDDSDMGPLSSRLVQTTMSEGLLDEHVDRAIQMLKKAK
jgi:hypothetical protein